MSPAESLQLLQHYGIIILPLVAVAEQLGIPLPAVPVLLGVGALAAHGHGNIPLTLGTLMVVALAVDFGWYEFGRRRGVRVLNRLFRFSSDPNACMRRAESVFRRFGARAMLFSKFVPGLTTILPPLAGMFGVGRVRFALYELGGVLLWAGAWMGLGYVFSDAVALIAARVEDFGLDIVLVLGIGLGSCILIKYLAPHRFSRAFGTRGRPFGANPVVRGVDLGDERIAAGLSDGADPARR